MKKTNKQTTATTKKNSLMPVSLRTCWSLKNLVAVFLLCCSLYHLSSPTAANKSSAIMSTHIVACLLLYRHRQVNLPFCFLFCFMFPVPVPSATIWCACPRHPRPTTLFSLAFLFLILFLFLPPLHILVYALVQNRHVWVHILLPADHFIVGQNYIQSKKCKRM